MSPRKRKTPASPAPPPRRLEYQYSDGAWYSVRLVVQGGSLRVMYEEFLEESDVWYDPGTAELASPRDVAALRARFRLVSPPLDDAGCGDLRPGQRLCVFRKQSNLDRKYFDAVLGSVKRAPHDIVDGKEQCVCRFKVQWTKDGVWEEVGIEDVSCVHDSPVQDPVLSEFLDSVMKSFSTGEGDATAASQSTGANVTP